MRTHVFKALSAVVAIVMLVVLAFGAAMSPEPVHAAPAPQCIVQVQGTVGIVICADVPVAQIPLPTVTVQGPTITLPPVTLPPITLPAETVTVQVPGGTQTVTLPPGDTETVTEEATVIVTAEPDNSQPSSLPSVSPSETGQNPPGDDIIVDNDDDDPPLVDLGDGKTTIVEAALGLFATIALVGLMLLTLWAGYVIGYKDKEKKDTSFMRSLLEQARLGRAKHR